MFFTFREVTRIALRINKKYILSVFFLNAIWGSSAIIGFYLEKLMLDRLVENIGNPDVRVVIYVLGLLVAARLALELTRSLLGRFVRLLRGNMSLLLESEFDMLMSRKMAELDIATLEDSEFQDKFTKIRQESGRRAWGLMMPLSDIPNYLVSFISVVGVLFFIHPLVAVLVILVSIPQVIIESRFIKKDYQLTTELAPLYRKWGWLTHYLTRNRNYMELKILNLSGYLSRQLKDVQQETNTKIINLDKKRELSNFGSEIPFMILEFCITLFLVVWVVVGRITLGTFQLYLRSLRSAQMNLTSLVSSFLEIYENYVYVSDLVWFLNLESKIEKVRGGVELNKKDQLSIEFQDVWFRYKKGQAWVIKGVSFKIGPKENLALVGLNGSGKSTLVKLLARFYDPQKGKILINGHNIRDVDLASWRAQLAVLFQEFETYPFSAAETIGYGDVERLNKLSEIKEAAKITGMHEFIESLPLKYSNPLDPQFDKGVRPSLGQGQRLGISRVLFRVRANVIIMDEPTASVDPEAEEKIFKELVSKAKNKILLFVTQRFSTVRLADKILVMDRGRLIENGSHEELMNLGGKYAKLFNLQARAYQ